MEQQSIWVQLPKVNLHHHLEGAIRPETFLDCVQIYQVPVPVHDLEETRAYLRVSETDQSLADFLVKVDRSLMVSQYPGVLERMAFEAVEDAHDQNVSYIELRFGPLLHLQKNRRAEEAIEEVLAGVQKAAAQYPITARVIVCALRHHDAAVNLTLAKIAAKYVDQGVAGFDIAGDEASYPAGIFAQAFDLAKASGLGITVHAGEVGDGSGVIEAITTLGACRIGHGIHIANRPDLVEKVNEAGVTLEVCPTSNVHTRAVTSLAQHPIRRLFDHGVLISLGDDDPTTSGITISSEYQLLAEVFHFSPDEIAQIVLNGAQAAFLPSELKQQLVAELQEKLNRWRHGLEN